MSNESFFTPRRREFLAWFCAIGLVLPPAVLLIGSVIEDAFTSHTPSSGDWGVDIALNCMLAVFIFGLVIVEYFALRRQSRIAGLLIGSACAVPAVSLMVFLAIQVFLGSRTDLLNWLAFLGICVYFTVIAIGHYQWVAMLHAKSKHRRGFPLANA